MAFNLYFAHHIVSCEVTETTTMHEHMSGGSCHKESYFQQVPESPMQGQHLTSHTAAHSSTLAEELADGLRV